MSLEFFFRKKISVTYFCILFSIFVYLLPCFINESSHNTLSVFAESAIEHILMAIAWLYGFESFIWFFCLLSICSFCNHVKNWIPAALNSFYGSISNRAPMGYFIWFLMVFIISKLIVLKKANFSILLFLFSIV